MTTLSLLTPFPSSITLCVLCLCLFTKTLCAWHGFETYTRVIYERKIQTLKWWGCVKSWIIAREKLHVYSYIIKEVTSCKINANEKTSTLVSYSSFLKTSGATYRPAWYHIRSTTRKRHTKKGLIMLQFSK